MARQAPDLRTRAEATDYVETSSYDDVMRIVKGIVASSPLAKDEKLRDDGRGPRDAAADPLRALRCRRLKPRGSWGGRSSFVQANIHAGEVEGKEASLILARRLASGDLRPLLKQLVVLIAPIYNADGNEKVDVMNRTAQNGPVGGVGTRENAKGLDLNRDYMKLDSAEARALVGLMNRWDPHVGDRSAHDQRLVSRLSPDLFADAQPERRCPPDRARARAHAAGGAAGGAEEAQLPHLLLRQLRVRVRHGARERARRSGQARATPSGARSTTGRASATTTSACATAWRSSPRRTAISISAAACASRRCSSRKR